jgi:hypothetical protein
MLEEALKLTANRLAARNARRAGTLLAVAQLFLATGCYREADDQLASAKSLLIGFQDTAGLSIQVQAPPPQQPLPPDATPPLRRVQLVRGEGRGVSD